MRHRLSGRQLGRDGSARKALFRRGTETVEHTHMDAVGGAYLRGGPGKFHGMVAAVLADSSALVVRFIHIQSLCSVGICSRWL